MKRLTKKDLWAAVDRLNRLLADNGSAGRVDLDWAYGGVAITRLQDGEIRGYLTDFSSKRIAHGKLQAMIQAYYVTVVRK